MEDYFLYPRSRFITKSVPIPEDEVAFSSSDDTSTDDAENMSDTSCRSAFFSIAYDVGSSFYAHHVKTDMYADLEAEDLEVQEMSTPSTSTTTSNPPAVVSQSVKHKFQLCIPAAQLGSCLTPTLGKLHL